MGLIQNLIKGMGEDRKEFKEKFKQAEEDMKIQHMIEERQKSANRREVERYAKEQEEEETKMILDKIRKKQTRENWNPKHKILSSQNNILKDDRPILKEKNIFARNKSNILTGGNMFLK